MDISLDRDRRSPRGATTPFAGSRLAIVLVLLIASADARQLSAQSLVDRVVRSDSFGQPIVAYGLNPFIVGALSVAAGVPIGMEALEPVAPPPYRHNGVNLTGRTVQNAFDALILLDPRYEWREMDGVVVIRPHAAWSDEANLLQTRVNAAKMVDVRAADVLGLAAGILSARARAAEDFPDTKPFSFEIPPGTILDVLNAAVRAHGELSWVLAPTAQTTGASSIHRLVLHLWVGGFGKGTGVTGVVPSAPIDLSSFAAALRAPLHPESVLDRVVRPRRDGQPLVLYNIWEYAVEELARAAGVPMGIERIPPSQPPSGSPGAELSGRPLRDALNALTALDPRYAWQEMAGVIVFRPVTAWNDPDHPLFRPVRSVQLGQVTGRRAIDYAASLLAATNSSQSAFPDSKSFLLDLPPGTILDLLNGIARAHGELVWVFRTADVDERRTGVSYWLTFSGYGTALP